MKPFSVLLVALGVLSASWSMAQNPSASKNPNASKNPSAAVIAIDGEIGPGLAKFLKRNLEQAEKNGATLVVLDINTPGGRVDSALEMSDSLLKTSVPTLAVVTNAFSAGALIAMSAEQLAMLPGSEIGAALPITGAGEALTGDVGEKINSALRTKFKSVAATRGRNSDAAEGMVNPNKDIPGLKPKGEILTLTASEAVKHDIANFEARTLEDAVKEAGFNNVKLERLERNQAERLGEFLTQPLVAAILIGLGLLGLIVELLHPGLAFPGVLGVVCLAAYFGGTFLTGGGSGVAFLLFLAGLLLLMAELLFIPGFGFAGLGGIASLLGSIYLSFGDQFLTVSSIAVVVAGLGLALAFYVLPRSRATRPIFLGETLAGGNAATPSDTPPIRVGQFGTALSDLRPSGVANLEGTRSDVVSDGEFIALGTALEVIRVEGRRVVVKAHHP